MNPLNPFALSGLLIVIAYLPLLVLLFKTGETLLTRIYTLHIFCVLIWGIGAFFIGILNNEDIVTKVWGPAYAAVLFIPVFFYHSVHMIIGDKKKWKVVLCYSQAILFTILIFTGVLMKKNEQFLMFHSMYIHKATIPYTLSFILWVFFVLLSHFELYQYCKRTYPNEKVKLNSLLWALIGFVGGASNFLPAYRIDFYPYGNFLVPIHSFFVTYAILHHKLFDIKIVFKKSLAYSLLILLAAFLYFIIILISEKFVQGFWGYRSLTISILTAFSISILFFPLHGYLQRIIDRFIFTRTTEEISNENELLRAEVFKSEKLKSVAVLASGMAHEIKNPLTALKTFSEYLPSKLEDKEFLMKFSKIVGGEVNRIDELVNELLEFAKPAPIQLKATNPNKMITDTLDFLNSKFLQHKVTVKTDLSPECDAPIMLDPNKIRQALLNLFLNAIDAMKPGGTLTVATHIKSELKPSIEQLQIAPSPATPLKENIYISITDNGCGIEQDKLVTIFDPFYSTKDSGTGLGLPITHGILKDHGGEIKVASTVGRGTTFTLIIPKK